jgi:hypothetical protein
MTEYQGGRPGFSFRQVSVQHRHFAYFQINIANSTYPMYTCVCYPKHIPEVSIVLYLLCFIYCQSIKVFYNLHEGYFIDSRAQSFHVCDRKFSFYMT